MNDRWVDFHIRIRPDQKAALNKKHPENLAPIMRDIIDIYLMTCKSEYVKIEELDRDIEAHNETIASLTVKKNMLFEKISKSQKNKSKCNKGE